MSLKINWPVAGKYPISFYFGEAPEWYVKIMGYPHNGIDIACPMRTPIKACDEGEVIFSDDIPDSNGCGTSIEHSWGSSLYWHLDQVVAKAGQKVKRGEIIGFSGKTGFATGPHLHFAVKVLGVEVPGMKGWSDPLDILADNLPEAPEPSPKEKYHIVMPGDTLWGISLKYYGFGYYWRRIYNANTDKIKDPNLIHPLQRLLIP